MTDLEMTRLCAEAMGYYIVYPDTCLPLAVEERKGRNAMLYNPLHDDAQAMALVKKFNLSVEVLSDETGVWMVVHPEVGPFYSHDLNRAIVECVAKMQESKHG